MATTSKPTLRTLGFQPNDDPLFTVIKREQLRTGLIAHSLPHSHSPLDPFGPSSPGSPDKPVLPTGHGGTSVTLV